MLSGSIVNFSSTVSGILRSFSCGVTVKYDSPIYQYLFTQNTIRFFSVLVLCTQVNDVCDVTRRVYPHRASLKNMPGHGGNRTYDLWNTSPMLCQLSYAVRSVRVCDISELCLVPSISM